VERYRKPKGIEVVNQVAVREGVVGYIILGDLLGWTLQRVKQL